MDVYEMITNKIIEQLEKGCVPWQKPWNCVAGAVSHTNGRPYSMLNQYLLENIAGEWLTFNQIKAEGGNLKKGEKAHFVVFWSFINKVEKDEDGNEITHTFPMLKYYNVFHISQCEGIKEKYPVVRVENNEPIANCERVIADYMEREDMPIHRDMDSNRAFYSPLTDTITVPNINQYPIIEEYYSTLFHEITHSTGAQKRLNRDGVVKFDTFGSEQYSKEELIAEMGAAFLCNQLGLDSEKAFANSASYIQSWLKQLKSDKRFVVSASAKAEQAVKFILTGEKPKES